MPVFKNQEIRVTIETRKLRKGAWCGQGWGWGWRIYRKVKSRTQLLRGRNGKNKGKSLFGNGGERETLRERDGEQGREDQRLLKMAQGNTFYIDLKHNNCRCVHVHIKINITQDYDLL